MTAWCDHDNYVDEREFCNPVTTRHCIDCGARKRLEPEPHEHYFNWATNELRDGRQQSACKCGATCVINEPL